MEEAAGSGHLLMAAFLIPIEGVGWAQFIVSPGEYALASGHILWQCHFHSAELVLEVANDNYP